MGVPNQTELDLRYSIGESDCVGNGGGCGGDSGNSISGNRLKPPPSPPEAGSHRLKPPPPSPPTVNSRSGGSSDENSSSEPHHFAPTSFFTALPESCTTVLPSATFAVKETANFDCGGSVEMWFMCRLFSPRRRQRRRSGTSGNQQTKKEDDEKEEVEEEEEEEEGEEDSVASGDTAVKDSAGCEESSAKHSATKDSPAKEDSTPQPDGREYREKRASSGGVTARDCGVGGGGGGGTTFKMDVSEDDNCDDLMLDSEVASAGESVFSGGGCDDGGGGGDDGDDGDVDTCVTGADVAEDDGAGDGRLHHLRDSGGGGGGRGLGSGGTSPRDKASNVVTEGDEGLKEQLAMVQAMVQEMKVGFMSALEQLTTMQDGDQNSWQEMDSTCKRQEKQLSDFMQSMESLKAEVSSLTGSVNQVISTQQSLQDRLVAMQTGQQHLMDELVSTGILSYKARNALAKYTATADNQDGGASTRKGEQTSSGTDSQGSKDQDGKTDVTTAACKSLSLTQALAARCQDIDVSDSSEEEISSPHMSQRQMNESQRVRSMNGKSQNSSDSPQRRQAVQEIVDSEQEYCTQLWTVVNVYQLPLQAGHYMSSRQLCILFPSALSELCEQHCQMLHSLQDRLVHWSYAGVVGDVFARMTDSNSNLLGVYQEYVEGLPGSISCLRRQLAHSRSFRVFVKGQRESSHNSDLLMLLISPLQRIPKYMLQLQQVLRHTPEDHPDHFNLQASLSKLQDFVERFNHDITHTTQAIALDLQHLQAQGSSFRSSASGSSCEVMPATTSTIDSGVHSTGEDTFPPRFIRNGRNEHDGYLPKWLEQNTPYHQATDPHHMSATPRRRSHPQHQQPRLASHSQPDLTYPGYNIAGGATAIDPSIATTPHTRSHHKMAAAATSADRSARQRRYKIKKRADGPNPGTGQFNVSQTQLRPTSAVDFTDSRERVVTRPHSVMGPFPGDGRNRVIQVYSRGKPPRSGQRQNDSQAAQAMRSIASPGRHPVVNGQWDLASGGGGGGDYDGQYAVNYDDDEEDDTRALSDAHSGSSSHKLSSQDAAETDTDNSDEYSQEDLAAAVSHHLNGGGGVVNANSYNINAHDLRLNNNNHHYQPQTQVNYPAYNGVESDHNGHGHYGEEEEDENIDVQLDSPESGSLLSSSQHLHRPPEHMSEELKLDLTCFHDENEGKAKVLPKRALSPNPGYQGPKAEPVPLSMKPMGNNNNNSAESVPMPADRSQTEPSKEVVDSLSGEKPVTSLPPIRQQDVFPNVHDTNSRVFHAELDRSPVRRSVTPNEFSGVIRPAVMRRAATPSEFITGGGESATSKVGRRRKDSKNASTENIHCAMDEVSLSASKKKPFRTSLKNLFQRKKGSVILDELEREYTKELVRTCLTKNGHSNTVTRNQTNINNINNNNITTATIINNDLNVGLPVTRDDNGVGVGVASGSGGGCDHGGGEHKTNGDGESESKPNILGIPGNSNTNHHHHHHLNGHSLWSKMRKSPLFFLYRSSDGSSSESTPV